MIGQNVLVMEEENTARVEVTIKGMEDTEGLSL